MRMSQFEAQELLSLKAGFTRNELKTNYKKAMLSSHPDKGGSTEDTKRINQAFDLLKPLAVHKSDEQEAIDRRWFDERKARNEGHPLHSNRLPAMKSYESLLKSNFFMLEHAGVADDLFDTKSSIHFNGFYYQEDGRDYHVSCGYGSWSTFVMYDITDGGRSGKNKSVKRIEFRAKEQGKHFSRNDVIITNLLYTLLGDRKASLTKLFTTLVEKSYQALEESNNEFEAFDRKVSISVDRLGEPLGMIEIDEHEFEFSIEICKPTGYLNPYTLQETLKPVKELPERLTIRHLMRILVNGQFCRLKQNFHLSDDHLFDTAFDFSNGYIDNPFSIIKSWFGNTRRSCTRLYADKNNNIDFGSHSNDSMSLVFVEGNRYSAVDLTEDINQIEATLRLPSAA
ncbi:hypothetical protein [Vibrio owensii]|uniref:hypothetical protein n=1 Tax=Vibrio owensii TaxID=696485 RepID=UPI0018F11788|nr:hypothetical protein [Vibrio owensii]